MLYMNESDHWKVSWCIWCIAARRTIRTPASKRRMRAWEIDAKAVCWCVDVSSYRYCLFGCSCSSLVVKKLWSLWKDLCEDLDCYLRVCVDIVLESGVYMYIDMHLDFWYMLNDFCINISEIIPTRVHCKPSMLMLLLEFSFPLQILLPTGATLCIFLFP
jgi:hypothetical protein